jgi:hypothetical protein
MQRPGYICAFFIFLNLFNLFGQEPSDLTEKQQDSVAQQPFFYIIDGDSIAQDMINLNEVILLENIRFDSREARRQYMILSRKTQKVYPYARLAAERLETMSDRLETIENKKLKRIYTRRMQRYVEEEFSKELKEFTRSEGQILVKLIHRQTGATAYDLVKELRTGWRAFRYNVTAGLFEISLKEEYRPFENKEDFLIEDILERAFQNNILERQKPAVPINYLDLRVHWNKKAAEGK